MTRAVVHSTRADRIKNVRWGDLRGSASHRYLSDRDWRFGNGFDRRRFGAGLSDAAGTLDCRLRTRGFQRHHCAVDRPAAVGAAGPAILDREQARRRRQHRHRIGDQCQTRWLHRAAGQSRQLHQHLPLFQTEFQFPARYRAGRVVHAGAERDDGEWASRCEDGRRVHRLREGQPGQGQHGLSGQRHVGASVRRNVHGHD